MLRRRSSRVLAGWMPLGRGAACIVAVPVVTGFTLMSLGGSVAFVVPPIAYILYAVLRVRRDGAGGAAESIGWIAWCGTALPILLLSVASATSGARGYGDIQDCMPVNTASIVIQTAIVGYVATGVLAVMVLRDGAWLPAMDRAAARCALGAVCVGSSWEVVAQFAGPIVLQRGVSAWVEDIEPPVFMSLVSALAAVAVRAWLARRPPKSVPDEVERAAMRLGLTGMLVTPWIAQAAAFGLRLLRVTAE